MLPPATVTIASLRVITCDLPERRTTKGKIVDKNNTLIIIKIVDKNENNNHSSSFSKIFLVTYLEQEPK
jgi:hypothetical protein